MDIVINMGRSLGLLCLCILGGCLVTRISLDPDSEVTPRIVEGNNSGLSKDLSTLTDASSNWILGFWVKLTGLFTDKLIDMKNPDLFMLLESERDIDFGMNSGYHPETNPDNFINKWMHLLLGSTSSVTYYAASLRTGNQYFYPWDVGSDLLSSTTIILISNEHYADLVVMIK